MPLANTSDEMLFDNATPPPSQVKKANTIIFRQQTMLEYYCQQYCVPSRRRESMQPTLIQSLRLGLLDFWGKNHHVYFNNFTNTDLLLDLEKEGIYGCGTVRRNHKRFPDELKDTKLENRFYFHQTHANTFNHFIAIWTHTHTHCRGDSLTVQMGNVSASAWMDRKKMEVMCTNCQPTTSGVVHWRQRDGTRIEAFCPESIIQYNKLMTWVISLMAITHTHEKLK